MSTRSSSTRSYLDLAREVDAVPHRLHEPEAYQDFVKPYYAFKVAGYDPTLGLVSEQVVHKFKWPAFWSIDENSRVLTLSGGHTVEERTKLVLDTLTSMSQSAALDNIDRPKGEALPVFGPRNEHLFDMDRAAAVIFGIVTYGVQMLAYVQTNDGIKYWVPRRAKTKRSYPGMLDNCVGGALDSGETPLTCLAREASEEASLPQDYVREYARPYGVVSYHMATNGNGEAGHQPQIMYVYNIELPADIVPTPSDGEVEKFELMNLEEVQTALRDGEFKANCALTWISYMIAKGIINSENEPDLHKITTHLHRRMDFPVK